MRDAVESEEQYCRKNSVCFSVDEDIVGDAFADARGQALLQACIAWNFLDQSKRYRIKLPATAESCPDYKVAEGELVDGSPGSDSGSESNECGDE